MRRLADEDVSPFGEQLQRLGDEVADREFDSDTRHDYQVALNACERAKWDAPRRQQLDEICSLVDPWPRDATHWRACRRGSSANRSPS